MLSSKLSTLKSITFIFYLVAHLEVGQDVQLFRSFSLEQPIKLVLSCMFVGYGSKALFQLVLFCLIVAVALMVQLFLSSLFNVLDSIN